MISEGPALIEALPGDLQNALNGAVPPDEEIVIAVRGTPKEAFAASKRRVLHLIAPAITGTSPVDIRDTPIDQITAIRSEAKPIGGKLIWTAAGSEHSIDYPTYDGSKYNLVTIRLKQMIGEQSKPKPPPQAPAFQPTGGETPCPKCGSGIPETAAWCPSCGLQAFDPCWECGKAVDAAAHFCAFCGTPHTEPAIVQCPECQGIVQQGRGYCTQCGTQARAVCSGCDRPMRKEWKFCPHCGGDPVWEAAGIDSAVAHLTGDEPNDPSAWLSSQPLVPAAAPSGGPSADADELNRKGTEAYEAERYDEAIRLFQQATDADPANAGFWTNLGVAASAGGDDPQALKAYQKATQLNPREISAFLFMGQLLLEQERYSEAKEAWERVVKIDPDSEEAEEARENLRNVEQV